MSESRPNLPTRPETRSGRPTVRGETRRASRTGSVPSVVPTIDRVMKTEVSGAVTRLVNFEQQKTETRKQELLDGAVSGLETSTALVIEQNEILKDIIDIIKRVKLEYPSAEGTDIDLDLDRRKQRKGQKGRGRTARPKPTQRVPKATGRVPQIKQAPRGAVPQASVETPKQTPRPPAPVESPRPPAPPAAPEPVRPPAPVETPRPPATPEPVRPPAPVESPRPPPTPEPIRPPAPIEPVRTRIPPVEVPTAERVAPPAQVQQAERITAPPAESTGAARQSTRGLTASKMRAAGLGALFTAIDGLMLVTELDQIEYEYSTNQINQEEYKRKYSSAFGSFLGSTAGAAVLGSIGAVIGAPLFGLGSLVLGTIGGVVGSFAGSQVGSWIGETVAAGLINDTPPRPPNPRDMTSRDQEEIRQLLLDQEFRSSISPNMIAVLEIISDESQINLSNRRQARGARNILNSLIEENQSTFAQAYRRREQQPAAQLVDTAPEVSPPATAVEEPAAAVPAEPKSDAQELLANVSNAYQGLKETAPIQSKSDTAESQQKDGMTVAQAKKDSDRVAAEPIVRSLLREEDIESALPYSESMIDTLSKTEFGKIELEADKIVFDGEIKFAKGGFARIGAVPLTTVPQPASPPPAPAEIPAPQAAVPAADATQTAAAPVTTADSTEVPAAAAATTGVEAAPAIEIGASLATPVALPSPAAAAPAGQPPATEPQQQAPSTPQQGGRSGGDFMTQVNEVSNRLGINPANLLAVMRSESSLNPRAVNSSTGASGLIQFMPRTAQSLGTSVEAIRQMSAAEQMPLVERFFRSVRLPPGASAGKLYAYVFLPGRANREVLTQAGENFYEANRGLDVDRDGKITIADLDSRLARFGGVGGATMQAAAPSTGSSVAGDSAQQVISDRDRARTAAAGGGEAQTQRAAGRQDAGSSTNRAVGSVSGEVPLMKRLQGAAA